MFPIATLELSAGGRIGIAPLPGFGGNLASDFAGILAWTPDHILSMTEQSEMEAVGSGRFGELCAQAKVAWAHLPVRDYGGLSQENAGRWPALSRQLHEALDGGGAVLVHCKGGQGRSGMIALRLLVERGESAVTALSRLRGVRPGAVETEAQMDWALCKLDV